MFKVTINPKSLASFIRIQALYVLIAVAVIAMFWAIGQPVNPHQFLTFVLYSLLFSNLVSLPVSRLDSVYAYRPFPYNWLTFLAVLLLVSLPAYFITGVLVWWLAPPFPISLTDWITKGWKFPLLIVLVYGPVRFLYEATKERLEQRNLKLQQLVDVGAARLEMQEQELQRARRYNNPSFPRTFPNCRDLRLRARGILLG